MPPHDVIAAAAPAFWWVSPLVIAIGGVIAALAIATNKEIARMKATLDLIERTENSDTYTKQRKSFRALTKDTSDAQIARLINPIQDTDLTTAQDIFRYLNHYELVSIGCRNNILDEQFYRLWMRTSIIADWHTAERFIIAARNRPTSSQALFVEFEAFAKRMDANLPKLGSLARLGRLLSGRAALVGHTHAPSDPAPL